MRRNQNFEKKDMKRKTSLERSFDTVSFKKDKTLVDPVFKKPGIIIIIIIIMIIIIIVIKRISWQFDWFPTLPAQFTKVCWPTWTYVSCRAFVSCHTQLQLNISDHVMFSSRSRYLFIHTQICKNLKATIICITITWYEIEQWNQQAKKLYC